VSDLVKKRGNRPFPRQNAVALDLAGIDGLDLQQSGIKANKVTGENESGVVWA
jgi:hypothetical protein